MENLSGKSDFKEDLGANMRGARLLDFPLER